ncbi:hypothetical protein ATK36_4895 [Amycolatopsis sulphurea]|uniref:Uncharacterized protein n=1 Tax=Amycolatopsis sulphurea TaxID=76022 RepID=A0A2A9FG49_9PSEU|nr:hypothetical protein ATK36_4895 [Amycolatopsis sulphurea]
MMTRQPRLTLLITGPDRLRRDPGLWVCEGTLHSLRSSSELGRVTAQGVPRLWVQEARGNRRPGGADSSQDRNPVSAPGPMAISIASWAADSQRSTVEPSGTA